MGTQPHPFVYLWFMTALDLQGQNQQVVAAEFMVLKT